VEVLESKLKTKSNLWKSVQGDTNYISQRFEHKIF
jgi:hypothetical protein